MIMGSQPRSLKTLEKEIRQLQARADRLEQQLDDNLRHLQQNAPSLIMGSFFSGGNLKTSFLGTAAGWLLGNERLRDASTKIINSLLDNMAALVDTLAEKITQQEE
jgi:hypothetical protein